ncbi:MAG: DUF4349 domain-containing protein [Deltaproteobacteria bacterium]|nr:DUF4349 domain-containing protein [Deltaproteobacteria bacterium]
MNGTLRFVSRMAVAAALLVAAGCAKLEQGRGPMELPTKQGASFGDEAKQISAGRMAEAAEPSRPAVQGRILVKTGALTLIVGEAGKAQEKLAELVTKYDGYVAGKQAEAWIPHARYLAPSEVRQMTYTLKIPADRFDEFVGEVKTIGSYTNESMNIEDVTFEYVDLDARLSNQKKVEQRLLGHLETSARELKDIVEVERELARVREQIETLTAQFKVLQDRVAFSTLTLTISVQADFVPPVERTYFQELGDKFMDSLKALGDAIKVGSILALAALPWLLVLGGLGYGLLRLARWRRKRKNPG